MLTYPIKILKKVAIPLLLLSIVGLTTLVFWGVSEYRIQQKQNVQQLKQFQEKLSKLEGTNQELQTNLNKLQNLISEAKNLENVESNETIVYRENTPDYSELITTLEERIVCWKDDPPKTVNYRDCEQGPDFCISRTKYESYHDEEVMDAVVAINEAIQKLKTGTFVDIYSDNAGPDCPTKNSNQLRPTG